MTIKQLKSLIEEVLIEARPKVGHLPNSRDGELPSWAKGSTGSDFDDPEIPADLFDDDAYIPELDPEIEQAEMYRSAVEDADKWIFSRSPYRDRWFASDGPSRNATNLPKKMNVKELRQLIRRTLVSEMKLGIAQHNPPGQYFDRMPWDEDEPSPASVSPMSVRSKPVVGTRRKEAVGAYKDAALYNKLNTMGADWSVDEDPLDDEDSIDITDEIYKDLFAAAAVDPFPPSSSGIRKKK